MSIVKSEGEMHFRASLKTPTIILTERHLLIPPFLFSLLFFSNYFSRICRHVDWKFISMVNRFSQNSHDYFQQNFIFLFNPLLIRLSISPFSNFTFSPFFQIKRNLYKYIHISYQINIRVYNISFYYI